jgi:catechol 2,3-dioxygenase-like lactoylglutathione lyase family enzyme
MKKLHIALSTNDIAASIKDYTTRLGCAPCSEVANEYALWRTESLNFSIRQDVSCPAGELRHLGWEDDAAEAFSEQKDINGVTWERFSAAQQAEEINALWPEAKYLPS